MRNILSLALVLVVVSASSVRKRSHDIFYVNNCDFTLTPVFGVGESTFHAETIGPGGQTRLTIAEDQAAWRTYAQTGTCTDPYGVNCTILECSFNNPEFRQCDISRIDGFNVGIAFSFSDPGCAGNQCLSDTCPPEQAFSDPTNGGASIRQCNTPNVSMTVVFC